MGFEFRRNGSRNFRNGMRLGMAGTESVIFFFFFSFPSSKSRDLTRDDTRYTYSLFIRHTASSHFNHTTTTITKKTTTTTTTTTTTMSTSDNEPMTATTNGDNNDSQRQPMTPTPHRAGL